MEHTFVITCCEALLLLRVKWSILYASMSEQNALSSYVNVIQIGERVNPLEVVQHWLLKMMKS